MTTYIKTLEELYHSWINYLNNPELDNMKKKEIQDRIDNWSNSMKTILVNSDDIGHTRIETIDNRSIRILGYRKDLNCEFPIIAFVTESDNTETLVEYNKFGYRNVNGVAVKDNYQVSIRKFYFDDGDYAASNSWYGILRTAAHDLFKFAINVHTGELLYEYYLDKPVRPCTEEEINTINSKFDDVKWKETCKIRGREV